MPVIAAAIAAPAASASGPIYSATLTLKGANTAGLTFVSSTSTGTGTNLTGIGPTSFDIQNTGSAITGTITGTVNIAPSGGVLAGAGIQSMAPAALGSPAYSTAHEYSATFSNVGPLASGETLNIPLSFQYQRVNPLPKKVTYSYTMTITLTLPDSKSVTLPGIALSVTFP
ncbi:hypothetical protein [Arthrobacter sp. Leaf337]|uniref:hypothetical protein n=1 Tax=Arthrobacter sp. Leaf337 TaxID=1736342 RepID=UPI001F258FC6|nr:hypothetical protein [Arthrobacter sp. Leaf337]